MISFNISCAFIYTKDGTVIFTSVQKYSLESQCRKKFHLTVLYNKHYKKSCFRINSKLPTNLIKSRHCLISSKFDNVVILIS